MTPLCGSSSVGLQSTKRNLGLINVQAQHDEHFVLEEP